jgi:Peptidase_C39 like family
MFNFRTTTALRTAAVVVFVGVANASVTSGCHAATPSMASPTTKASGAAGAPLPTLPLTAGGMYGDPAAAAKYWRQQSLEDNCGLVSVADVVGEITGNEPTEQQMVRLAQTTPSGTNPGPIYAPSADPSHSADNGGVEMADLVVLLDHYRIKSLMTYAAHPEQTGIPALQRYLGDGRKVIAWVNSTVIWNTSDQRTKADHYLVVTGIDTNKEIVHLNDPGADHPDEQVDIKTFTDAWQTGEESIVVTAAAS